MLGGLPMPNFLASRTFVAKFIGASAAQIAGLSIGRTGPFVHMATIISH